MSDKINQSKSNVGGDQIAGDKNTYNVTQNINQNITQNIGNMLYDSDTNIFSNDFNDFLENTELSVLSYEKKIRLSDLYIPIELKNEYSNKKINVEELINIVNDVPQNIIITGDSFSGKTSCIKYLIMNLSNNFTTIFIDGNDDIQFPIKSHIERMKKRCYNNTPNNETTIVFIDNFHQIKNSNKRKKILDFFSNKEDNIYIIITTDILYNFKIKENNVFNASYEILPLGHRLEDKLITNWLEIINVINEDFNKKREYYSSTLNNIMLKYAMPRYPFFYYTILCSLDNKLNSVFTNITSEYHCYYILILQSLSNSNMQLQLDVYFNILSELAYLFFNKVGNNNIKDKRLSEDIILDFLENDYKMRYSIDEKITIDDILHNLHCAKIFVHSDIREYYFAYPYIYYFFLGRYFFEHLKDNMENIKKMIDNLHILENSYIIIFLIYHIKDSEILDYLNLKITSYFKDTEIMTLNTDEVSHLDKYSEKISEKLLNNLSDVEKNREEHFKKIDEFEEEYNIIENETFNNYDSDDIYFLELKKSIKSIELMGAIIKIMHSSLLKEDIYKYFYNSINLALRLSNNLLNMLKKQEKEFINWIETKLSEEDTNNINNIKIIIENIIYDIYYLISILAIKMSSRYLCSENLIFCINKLKEEMPLPITFLIEKDIKLNYKQDVTPDKIRKNLSDKNISKYVKKIYIDLITSYCNINRINKNTLNEIEKIINRYYGKRYV